MPLGVPPQPKNPQPPTGGTAVNRRENPICDPIWLKKVWYCVTFVTLVAFWSMSV